MKGTVTNGSGRTSVTIKLDKADVTKPFLLYEVCFSSPTSSFKNLFGKSIPAGQAGLLPPCLLSLRRSDGPCLVAKWIDRDRNVFVRWVKEGRKYGLGCVLVTQQPSSISGQIISQGADGE